MKSLNSKFFPKGGFSSSQWKDIKKIKDVNAVNRIHQNDSKSYEQIMNQTKPRREHQKFNLGLST